MSNTIIVEEDLINDVNMLIAHYELGLSECLKIKKRLASVSTEASKKNDCVTDEQMARIFARSKKLRESHKKSKTNVLHH